MSGGTPSAAARRVHVRPSLLAIGSISLVMLVSLACAGTFVTSGEGDRARFRHRRLGYEIALPNVLADPMWQRQKLEASDLFVRHVDGSAWALASDCRATRASAAVLAAEFARVTDKASGATGAALVHAGLRGFSQRLERAEGHRVISIKTVTLRGERCTYDWILIAPSAERLGALEADFDTWWRSFLPGPTERHSEGEP